MNIHEYQAKELLRRFGITTLGGTMAQSPKSVAALFGAVSASLREATLTTAPFSTDTSALSILRRGVYKFLDVKMVIR